MQAAYIAYFDDFYGDPEAVRDHALAGTFTPHPGEFTGTVNANTIFPRDQVMQRIADLMGVPIEYAEPNQATFRSLTRDQFLAKTKHVHVDRMGYAGVLCLNPEYPSGGTSFYRHIETGLTGVHDRLALLLACAKHRMSLRHLLTRLSDDGSDLSRWHRVREVHYRPNRLIVFDSDLFHLAGAGFGNHVGDAKLTQNFRFRAYRRARPWRRLFLQSSQPTQGARAA